MPTEYIDSIDQENRFFTSAVLKYTDTTPGGNIAINPPPQFTSLADPKAPSRKSGGKGMGIYYSEALDDHAQVIHLRFGVPAFNSLTQFFTSFYNSGAGKLARTGRSESVFYSLGKAAGFVVSVMNWKLLAFHLMGVGLKFFLQKPSSRFYYLKPAMPVYWQVVQTIVNQIAVNKGIIPRAGGGVQDSGVNNAELLDQYQFGSSGLSAMHALLPDIFSEGGGIDVYAMANRAKRLERQQMKQYQSALDTGTLSSLNLSSVIRSIYGPQNRLSDTSSRKFSDYLDQSRTIS